MADPWTSAWEEAVASAPPDVLVYCTLELQHVSFDHPVRAVTDTADDQTFTLEDGAAFNGGEAVIFSAIPFYAAWPETGEKQAPQCTVTIDNVARELVPILQNALGYRGDLIAVYREYRSDDTSGPCYGPVEFTVKKVTVKGTTVSGVAQIANLANRKFPNRNYTMTDFPSLLPQS